MTTSPAVDVENKSVTFEGQTYKIQPLGDDSFTVLVGGVPVGRIVYVFGAAQGVPEHGGATSEDTLYAIAEAWFTATA